MSLTDAMNFTFRPDIEGGRTVDAGGLTYRDVTQGVYDAYREVRKLAQQPVTHMSDNEFQDIVESEYWTPAQCDKLTRKMGVCMFDWSFNHGVSGAIKTLQSVLGVEETGTWNARTGLRAADIGDSAIGKFLIEREEFYKQLVLDNPAKYGRYANGWQNRIYKLEDYLETLK